MLPEGRAQVTHCGAGLYYCEEMRRIRISVDDDTYERARVAAAALNTSVSALVKALFGATRFGRSCRCHSP